MKRSLLFCCASIALIVGCGGPSDDQRLSDLNEDEISSLCKGARTETKDCGSGVKVTSQSNAECEESIRQIPTTCTATVRDFKDCDNVDLCERNMSAACTKLTACGYGKIQNPQQGSAEEE